MRTPYELLFIHPETKGKARDDILPMGIFGLMNSLKVKKIGKMWYEVTDEIIRQSKIVAMDLYWYFSLFSVKKIAERIKKVNPEAKIILGGYTASIFAEILVKKFNIDFVIKGDAEVPFRLLVEGLIENKEIRDIPNIVARDFSTPHRFVLTSEVYSNIDNVSLEWFPSYQRLVFKYQKHGLPTFFYPFIPVLRGCIYECPHCYGAPSLQKKICRRGIVIRSAPAVRSDLVAYSKNPRVKVVYMIGDFIDFPGLEYADQIFCQRYDLSLYYEFYNLPSTLVLEKMLNCFNQCFFWFSIFKNHGERAQIESLHNLKAIIRYLKNKNCRVILTIDTTLSDKFNTYLREIINLWKKEYWIDLHDFKDYDIDIPMPREREEDLQSEFLKFYNRSRKNSISEIVERNLLRVVFKYKYLLILAGRFYSFLLFLKIYINWLYSNKGRQR